METIEQRLNNLENIMSDLLYKVNMLLPTDEATSEELQQYIYPLYCKSTKGHIVKFTGLREGVLVRSINDVKAGQTTATYTAHTNTDTWTPIMFNSDLGVLDKQLCECWDDSDKCMRNYRFYDAENGCTFSYRGHRDGPHFKNYKPIPFDEYPQWAIKAECMLED
jgi:hypothetical protein